MNIARNKAAAWGMHAGNSFSSVQAARVRTFSAFIIVRTILHYYTFRHNDNNI